MAYKPDHRINPQQLSDSAWLASGGASQPVQPQYEEPAQYEENRPNQYQRPEYKPQRPANQYERPHPYERPGGHNQHHGGAGFGGYAQEPQQPKAPTKPKGNGGRGMELVTAANAKAKIRKGSRIAVRTATDSEDWTEGEVTTNDFGILYKG